MKKALSLILALVLLIGLMPMQVFATEGTQETEAVEVVTEPTEIPEEEPEVIHEHDYEAVVTAPTCTEQGYITYTCDCGDSYMADYVDATGKHTYENGICTGCGEKLSFEGKTISILGDSISTFANISDDSTVNATLSGSTVYYSQGSLGGYRHTWWQQVIDTLGMELLVNNSWSGTCVLKTRGTVGAYIDRCVQLHNDRTGEQPDVIAVFLGTNDYSYYQSTLGTAEIDYAALITDCGDGTFDYAKPTTTCEAYAIMLHKMTQRYPDAEIYCLGMLSRRDPDHDGREVVPPPTSFNAELKAIVERFGGTYVDVESCIPATASEFDRYMSDRRVHPNAAGMDKITEAVVGTMLQRQVTLRNVSYDLHNVSCSKEPAAVIENEPFELTLTATDKDLDLAVRVTMGGEDITSECYANGKVSIAKVTGDIVITAMVLHGPSDYQWQFDNGELVSAGTNANQLTKLAGSTQDNVFSQTRYQLAVTAELIHTRPWVIEWAGEGKGGFMLSQTSSSTGAPFFFRRSGNYLTAFGHYNNNRYDNYGLTLDAANIDGAARHVYRLENRIAQNGNNMVWLLVDGIEIGALNNYYISGTSQGSTADWISGKDFHINYIGSTSHPLSGYALEYLSITECAHIYSSGICIGCGATQPGPVITQQPESVQQEVGKKFAITVKAEGEGLTYQWYVKENGAKAFKVSSNKTASYAYTMQTYMHNRQVYCVITDVNGDSVQTETATITRPPVALTIIEQPQDAQANIGEKFSISPKVEGDGLTYQWYVKESGAKAFKVSSNKTASYAYTMQSYMKGRQVYCVITDKYGNSVTTDVATISLPPVELKILEQPSDVYAVKGEKFSISFVVQGDGLTYQWYYKDAGMKHFAKSSNKTSAYAYSMQSYMDGRSVYCVITDQYGNQITTEIVTIDEDDGIYYLTESAEGTYTIYTLAKDGSRKYELNFTGTMNSNTNTITVTKVTSYPAEGVIIPALTTYTADKAVYAVSINPASPFADLGTMSASVSIIPVDGKKVGLTSTVLSNMFKRNNGTNFVSLDLSGLDTSNVTTMSYMFNGCSSLTELDLSGFDTTNVTNMANMFNGCSGLAKLDLSGFDTANVTNMYYMFGSCSGLTELDLSDFDTANVTNMANMFRGCSSLTELDVSGFDTANVTNMSWMFSGCKNLYDLDLSNWDMSKANTANMFYNCPAGA